MIFRPCHCFETGCAAYLLGRGGLGKCSTRVKVLHTPESASFVVTDLRRGTDPWFVLTGDTSRSEFVDALADVPPKPAAMGKILRINQGREEVRT